MKFKVGDKVRVRKGLKAGLFVNTQTDRIYICECENEIDRDYNASVKLTKYGEQLQYLVGKTLTIESISRENPFYEVKENSWLWTDEMLEPVIEVGDTVRINKNATIEDFTKDSWNGCQTNTLEFIRKHGDTDKTFVVSKISSYCWYGSGNLYLENEGGIINHAIFELVSKKEHKTKEVTMQEVCEKFGCNIVIKKEAE